MLFSSLVNHFHLSSEATGVVCAVVICAASVVAWKTAGRNDRSTAGATGIPSMPFYSDMLLSTLISGQLPDAVKLHAKLGNLFWWRFLGRRMLFVGGLEEVTAVMRGEHDTVEADYPPSVKALLGEQALINLTGSEHMRVKRLMQAAFTPKALRGYLPRLQATAEQAVQKWAKQGTIHCYPEMKWYTFRIAVELIVGFDDSWLSPEDFPVVSQHFDDWLMGLFSMPINLPGTAFHKAMKARAALMERINASLDKLEARRKAGEGSGGQPTSLDLLLDAKEDGKGLTREQIADSVMNLLFAGHDTSATTLTRLIHHLHNHPEAVEKLKEEQAAVLANHGTELTEEAMSDMQYADAVVRETLRVTPIVPGFPRIALKDFNLCGAHITKGTAMQCSMAQPIFTDVRWQGNDVLRFRPERWLEEAGTKAGGWIPFGGGPRLCIGWLLALVEMKALLAIIFRSHEFKLHTPDGPWLTFPLARPKDGLPASFTPTERAV